jgi:signal transduction histidine kinase
MSGGRSAVIHVLAVAGATLFFWLVIHQVSGLWLDVALRPEVRAALEQSRDDQKKLRALDAAHRDQYRRRFEATTKLLQRLDVIRMNREQMLRRFEAILVTIFALVAAIVAAGVWRQGRRAGALERRQYLDRVSALQENARRHAHEIKGPLTAARLELDRAGDALHDANADSGVAAALRSAADELETISRLTREQASFAAIGAPVLRRVSLGALIDEFCATFADAWPGVTLRFAGGDEAVCADRDMLRQVLVNLCSNSALAIDGAGSVTFAIAGRGRSVALDVTDTGGGIAESLRARVFDPYVTTRKSGEGTGLGLSISRKIMIDHGGDLQLLSTDSSGTTFRLTFGASECN